MNPQVLIVDDDPVVRDLLCKFLQTNGFDASVLHDGTHLQRRLERERPSVVVLDIMMPNTDGLRALTALRAAGDDIPVIFVTARGTVADRIVGLSLGAALLPLGGCAVAALPCRLTAATLKIVPVVGHAAATPFDMCSSAID